MLNNTALRLRDIVAEISAPKVLGVAHLSSEKKRIDATFCIRQCNDCGCDGDCRCNPECSRDCSDCRCVGRDCRCDEHDP